MLDEFRNKLDVLVYPADDLLDPRTSKLHKQLVIYHEWIHIRQHREDRVPEIRYEVEMEAYLAECVYAKEIGALDDAPICAPYFTGGEQALRKSLATLFL